jgi:hypothetical protein
VNLSAKTGLSIAYATVMMDGVNITAETGDSEIIAPTANVMEK